MIIKKQPLSANPDISGRQDREDWALNAALRRVFLCLKKGLDPPHKYIYIYTYVYTYGNFDRDDDDI